jgi:hypothetical protein
VYSFKDKLSVGRVLICAFFLLVSVLLIGAGKFSGRLTKGAMDKIGDTQREMVFHSVSEIPIEHRRGWEQISRENPALLVKVNTFALCPVVKLD